MLELFLLLLVVDDSCVDGVKIELFFLFLGLCQ